MSRVRDIANILSANTAMATDAEVTSSIASHTAAADPHTGYLKESEFWAAGKNKIINGDFSVWQRGTSFTNPAGATFTSDRWNLGNVSLNGSISRQAFTAGSAPVSGYESQYFMRADITSNSQFTEIMQRIEDVRTFAGQTVTISFWAKFNSGNSGWQVILAQNFGSGGSPSSLHVVTATGFTPTSSWQRFTYTVPVTSISGKTIGTNNNSFIYFALQHTSTSASQLDFWGVQVEAGSVATPFSTATGNPASELAACQRYYIRQSPTDDYGPYAFGYISSSTQAYVVYNFPVEMRTKPYAIDYPTISQLEVVDFTNGRLTLTGISLDRPSNSRTGLVATITGGTGGRGCFLRNNATNGAYLGFSAEL